jgi:hypothetical protein
MFKNTLLAALVVMLVAVGIVVAAPDRGPQAPPPKEKPADEPQPGPNAMDTSDQTMDMYKSGTMQAMYWVRLHKDLKAGQYWETWMEAHGTTFMNRWQVASIDGDEAVVENRNRMVSEFMVSDYVVAYRVNLKAKDEAANVKKAWIAKPGEEPYEITIMEVPESVREGNDAPGGEEVKEEKFEDLEVAGKKWSGTLYTTEHAKWWEADDGWFTGMVRMDSSGMITELKRFGDDAKPLLKWPKKEEGAAEVEDDKPDTEKESDDTKEDEAEEE